MANYITQEGYNKKMEELAALEAQRPMIKQAIAEARDKGDLSENAEYDAAKEAQGMLEMKIAKLKELIASARIIDDSKLNTDEVQLLNKVTIRNNHKERNDSNIEENVVNSELPFLPVHLRGPVSMIHFTVLHHLHNK